MSETSSARAALSPFCSAVGPNGVDLGAGGDPILPTTICIDRAEDSPARAHVGSSPTHLVGDVSDLYWFRDGTLDYVYSSHVLEDFIDTTAILREWLRVLRPGGHLVLFLPDQPTYAKFCTDRNALPNQAHKYDDFGLDFVMRCLVRLGYSNADVVHSEWPVAYNPYSFSLVIRKH